MKIDIASALKNSDIKIPFDSNLDLSEMLLNFGEKAIEEPVHVVGNISSRYEATWLDMTLDGNFLFACDRCGEAFHEPFVYEFRAMLTTDMAELDSEELVVAEGGFLDIGDVAQSIISLFAPSKHLCNEDCKGLCSVCGKNLNQGSCDCNKKKVDPRLAGLAKFFEENEED